MTEAKKSKLVRHLTTLFVGSSMLAGGSYAYAQSAGPGSVFDGELRGSIADRSTNNLDLNTAAGQRTQLLGPEAGFSAVDENTAVPSARPARVIPLSPRIQQRAERASPVGAVFSPQSPDQSPRGNVAAEPVQSGEAAVFEPDPFAATGFRLGTFEGDFSFEQSIGYSSNVSQNVDGDGGAFSQTDANLSLISDWSRHQLSIGLIGSYRRPFDSDEVDEPLFNANTEMRYDLVDGYTLTTRSFYTFQTQEFTSATLAPGAVDTPATQNYGGSVELQRTDRKLQFTLRGEIDRDEFDDADLGGGVVFEQDDLNNLEYGATLRVGYEVSPAITPFAEGRYAIRDFELPRDRNGIRRDSEIFELRGGVEIDLGEKAQSELALGYITEDFEDPSLENLDGFTLNGTLNWSPERDTVIALTFGTTTNASINPDENGSIIYDVGLSAERQITERWSLTGNLNYQLETNDDRNTTFEAGIGSQYWVNRYLALIANGEYVSFSSDATNSDFDEFSVRAGIRLQR
ncbi:MAG: outer membrane beta-barrel protein [Rhizobiaceae bacterium]|nr:outer membrane beta-barrel protein [Rhizobiaceae bacterium]